MAQNITALTVTNYKGVNGEITLHPDGSLVVIAGPNGAGKSSFIDAISEIFDPKGTRLTVKPIHDGAESASAEVVTDVARLVRTWKADKDGKEGAGTLAAYALDGAKYASGKDFVVKATGGALFDAGEFVSMDAKQQRAELLARVDLPFDLATLDREKAGIFEQRRDLGRVVDQLTGQLAGLPASIDGTPDAEVSAADIIAEFEKAREHNAKLDMKVGELERAQTAQERAEADVVRAEQALAGTRSHAEMMKKIAADLLAELKASPERIETSAISTRLGEVEEINARVRAGQEREKVAASLAAKREQHTQYTLALEAIDKKKVDALAAAQFPVEGLSVDDDGITVDGIPFRQVNTAKKTVIAFDLATSAKPDLRIVVIKDGDSLDADSLEGIRKIADERGYLVLVERDRDESRAIGFTIESGTLVGA